MNELKSYVTIDQKEQILDAFYIKHLLQTGKSKKEVASDAGISLATLNRRLKKVQDLRLAQKNIVIAYPWEFSLPIDLIEFLFNEARFLESNQEDIIERALKLYRAVATEYRKENPGNIKISDYISKE